MTINNKDQKIYDVMEVAKYCLYYCSQVNKRPISNLQLQKILYYIQAKFLVEKDMPCFDEDIVGWKYGPVVESVYRSFKIYSRDTIEFTKEKIDIEEEDKILIQDICNTKSKHDAFTLVRMTHEEDPWKKTFPDAPIELDIIKEYFKVNQDRLLI